MKTKFILIAGVILILTVASAVIRLSGDEKAPEITFDIIDGRQLSLESLHGRPVLINFWATTCPVCIREMPDLIELYKHLHPKGLEIIGVAMAYDPPNYVLAMSRHWQIPYPVALDIDASAARAFGQVSLTPTSILVSPQGRIVQRKIGAIDREAWRKTIQQML